MFRCLLMWLALGAIGMIIFLSPTPSTLAAACSPPGEVVVTDPGGDGPSPGTDVIDVAIQEVIAGPDAGKIIVTLHVSSLGTTASGFWVTGWKDATGNNSTTFVMNACEGVASFGGTYETPEGSETDIVDRASYTADGTIQWIVAREKIGNPQAGETFERITALAMLWVSLDPLPGCLPQGSSDEAGEGRYVVGSCLVDAPGGRAAVALRLGAPSPNPARADVSFALDVPDALGDQPFEVAMFDVTGRRQRTIASGTAIPGRTMLRWNLRDIRGERVRPGTYWARITVGDERRTQVFVVR